jgi:hypothetical protein
VNLTDPQEDLAELIQNGDFDNDGLEGSPSGKEVTHLSSLWTADSSQTGPHFCNTTNVALQMNSFCLPDVGFFLFVVPAGKSEEQVC